MGSQCSQGLRLSTISDTHCDDRSEDEASTAATKQEEAWPALGDRTLVPMVEQLFSHLLKVINICAHVLDDVAPGPAVKVTPHSGSSSLQLR